jgi:integrase
MRKRSGDRLGEIAGHWLSKRRGSEAWCRTCFDPATRQTRRASLGTEDLDEAKLALAAWVMANGRIEHQDANNVFAETCFVRYYEQHAKHQASGEQARYGLKQWSEFFPGALVSELAIDKQRLFVAWLRDKGLSDGYIRRVLAVGKAALNRARREGEITSAPEVSLALAPEGEPRERLLAIGEMAGLFNAATEPHQTSYLMMAVGLAARPEAIRESTTYLINFDTRLIRLNPPGRRQNKKRRPTVPLCDTLLSYLRCLPPGPIVQYRGRPLAGIKSTFDHLTRRAGLSGVSAYTVRHTMAAEMRRRGVPVWEVAGFLGHSSGYKTTEVYARYGADHLSEAVRAIEKYFTELRALGVALPPALRVSGVLENKKGSAILQPKPLISLVEPTGIEPVTSTMPL